jgi:DNA-binding NtrC family response regulator
MQPAQRMNRVLIIDNEPNSALALGIVLQERGFEVRVENDSARALECVRAFKPDAVLIDSLMPKANGGDVAWQLANAANVNGTKVILYSRIAAVELRRKFPLREIPILEMPIEVEELFRLLDGISDPAAPTLRARAG